ncbi:hypothetical protein R84B8_02193 [Treponema sp. R8-4-B8]
MDKTNKDIFITGIVNNIKVNIDKKKKKIAYVTLLMNKVEINGTNMEILNKEIEIEFFPYVWKKYSCEIEIGKEIFIDGEIDSQKNWFEQIVKVKEIHHFKRLSKEEYQNLPTFEEYLQSIGINSLQRN